MTRYGMLDNKIILVVGALGLLGQAIVKEIVAAGGLVVAVDKKKYEKEQGRVLFKEADITDAKQIANLIQSVDQELGPIHGAVNAAYPRTNGYGKDFLEVNFNDFTENVSMHLGGYFIFMQQCVSYALEKEMPFSLVNLSSIYGVIAPRFSIYDNTEMTMPVQYAAIKAGLQHLNTYVTAYTKGSHFRVNAISPGGILANQSDVFVQQYQKHCRKKACFSRRI